MTLSVIDIIIALVVVYLVISTLIFAARRGLLKSINRDKFALQRYRRSVFLSETLWGLGFIAITVVTGWYTLEAGRASTQVGTPVFNWIVVMVLYIVVRLVRAYLAAAGGAERLMKQFKLYHRSDDAAIPLDERFFPVGKAEPLQKIAVAPEQLDRDLND